MATFDPHEEPVKLVIAGPVGSGKSTAIRTISDDEPVSTDVPLTTGAIGDKTTTTVAFDYNTVQFDDETTLHVYGFPGQDYLQFMRPILSHGALGAILLLDGSSAHVIDECEKWLHSLLDLNPDFVFAIGVTKTEMAPHFSVVALREKVQKMNVVAPVFTVDARNREQISQLVRLLLLQQMD